MLKLKPHDCGRGPVTLVFDENCMGSSHQRCFLIDGVEGYGKYKTFRFDGVLMHCPFIPNFVDSSAIALAKMTVVK